MMNVAWDAMTTRTLSRRERAVHRGIEVNRAALRRLALAALVASPFIAQAQASTGLRQLTVQPSVVPPGTPVILRGLLPLDGQATNDRSIALVIHPANDGVKAPKPITLRARADTNGRFAYSWSEAKTIGTYAVVATSPGGRFTATDTFHVADVDDVSALYVDELQRLMEHAAELIKALSVLMEKLPPSPERAAIEDQWEALGPKMQQVMAAPKRLKRAFGAARPLFEVQELELQNIEFPADIELDAGPSKGVSPKTKALRKLDAWRAKAAAYGPVVDASLKASKTAGELCEVIDQVSEGIQFVSALFNLGTPPIGILVNFSKDVLASKAGALAATSGKQFLVGQSVKQLGTFGAEEVNLHAAAHGGLVDLTGQLTKLVFEKYCESISGPMSGAMQAEFFNGSGKWWTYSFEIDGRLVLRYAKKAPGTPRTVRGEFIGSGYNFGVKWRPPMSQEFIANTGSILLHQVFSPVGMRPELRPEFEGKMIEMASPRSFFVPVEGEIVNNRLVLRLQDARIDFENHTSAWGFYFLLSPLTLSIDYQDVELPYKGAHHLILRSAEDGPLVLPVKRTRTQETAEREFTRRKSSSTTNASYKLSIKLCSGGCS